MGKADIAVNHWLSDNERFADLFNGAIFEGERVVLPDELENQERESDIIISGKTGSPESRSKYRDIVKRWRKGPELAVLACESQRKIHYAMPVRNMLYDSLTYTEQIRMRWKTHEKERKKKECTSGGIDRNQSVTTDEYLSRFHKTDKIYPVITLVFYYGLRQWDGPRDIYGMFETEGEETRRILDRCVPNYRLNLLDAGDISSPEQFHSDLQQIFGMLKYRGDKEKLQTYMQHNREYFGNIDIETYQAIREFLHSEKMLKSMPVSEQEVKIDMCQALEDLYKDGVKDGKLEGLREGIREGINEVVMNMLKNGLTAADIRKYAGVTDSVIAQAEKILRGEKSHV